MDTIMHIRDARKDDATDLARLINEAGEGLPEYLWSLEASGGDSAFDVGEARAARDEGGFSYRNARILEANGETAAMLLGYALPDPYDVGDLDALSDIIRPLVELESLAPGSWYINAVATYEACRGKGFGNRLMILASELGRACGCANLSLIVASGNLGAKRLYERLGYRIVAQRPVVEFPGCLHGGDWLLMVKENRE
jgi:ribosomal protein S18 acetylase RimI-like enzyme